MAIDFLSERFQTDRYAVLAELRQRTRVQYREQGRDWLVLRHADVKTLFGDHQRLRSSKPGSPAKKAMPDEAASPLERLVRTAVDAQQLWLPQRDPPEHTRLKRIVQPLYNSSLLQEMLETTAGVADGLLDALVSEHPEGVDLVQAYIAPLMQRQIADLFDVPPESAGTLGAWSQDVLRSLELDQDDETYRRGQLALGRFHAFFSARLSAGQSFGPVLAGLLEAHRQGKLSEQELLAQCAVLYVSGHTTTQDLIGSAVYHLLQRPYLRDTLIGAPGRIADLVRETLRYEPPGQFFVRWAYEDMELLGQRIAAGDRVLLMVASANRDPEVFERPDRFDIDRAPGNALSFGHGIHACVGGHIAPRIAQTAMDRLLARLPRLRLDEEAALHWKNTAMFRGLQNLPVRHS